MKIKTLLCAGLTLGAFLLDSHFSIAAESPKQTIAESRAAFAKADKTLNDDYAFAKKKLSKLLFDGLKEEQRLWLSIRDELALDPSYSGVSRDAAAPKESVEYFKALTEITNERIAWVARWIAGDEFASLTGIWRSAHAGLMEVYEQGDKLHFAISVVWGPRMTVGAIAGTAEWNNPIGWFSDRGRNPDKKDASNFVFVSRQRTIEVVGAKMEEYGGNAAAFDGVYIRVGKLDEAGIARVLKDAASGVSGN